MVWERRLFASSRKGKNNNQNGRHNAVIMWDRQGVKFPNDICPHSQQLHHGFETISFVDCRDLGVKHEVSIDECIGEKDGRMIEKAAHCALDDLPLGVRCSTQFTCQKFAGKNILLP